MAKLVTIVAPTWNGVENLKYFIPSLKKQTFKNFDVIILDNGSSDQSVVKFCRKSGVKCIRVFPNKGYSGGCNRLFKAASKSKYTALFNDDMKLEPDVIEKLVGLAETDDRIGAVQPVLTSWDGKILESTGLTVTYGSFIATRGKGAAFRRMTDAPSNIFGISVGLFRNDALKQAKYFDEDFNPAYYEDGDLSMKIKALGYRIMLHPAAVVNHKGGITTDRMGHAKALSVHRNRYRFLKKWWTPSMWLKAIAYTPLVAGFYILKGETAYFLATFEFLTGKIKAKKESIKPLKF